MSRALRDVYRRLPASVRYSLRPLNALEESASFLPSRPRRALQELVLAYRSIASAVRHRGELALLVGPSRVDGAPLRVVTDLARDGLGYWTGLLFQAAPDRRSLGEVRGPLGFTRLTLPEADLSLLRLNRMYRGRARARGYLTVPAWVQASLDTRRSFDAIIEGERSGRNSRKRDVRQARKAGFYPVFARGPAEVRHFFEDWCVPFLEARFASAMVVPGTDWIRQLGRFCEVMWIERDGTRFGGAILERRGRALHGILFGLRDPADVREGVLSAGYCFMIERAAREGYDAFEFGGSRPVLSDGILRYKLKWGAVLTSSVVQWDYFAVGIDAGNEAARTLLTAHPLIAEDDGRLVVVTSGDAAVLPPGVGLSGALVPSTSGWTPSLAAAMPARVGS